MVLKNYDRLEDEKEYRPLVPDTPPIVLGHPKALTGDRQEPDTEGIPKEFQGKR